MISHYVPAYTEINGGREKAACGALVTPREHSTEPDCDACQAYLSAEADTYEETARALGVEFLPPATTETRLTTVDPHGADAHARLIADAMRHELEMAADTFRDLGDVLSALGRDRLALTAHISERHIRETLAALNVGVS